MNTAIGFDIGGTKISVAFIVGQEIRQERVIDYSRDSFVKDMFEVYKDLTDNHGKPESVGVCCAGLVDSENGIVRFAGNLYLENYPLSKELSEVIGMRVHLENDAKSAVWGEYQSSTQPLGNSVAGLIMGTGVGGALVVHGNLVHGKNGYAGEIGHLTVSNSESICACGQKGCLETVASGRALENYYAARSGKVATAREILSLVKQGDELAIMCFKRVGVAVGEVIAQLINALDVDSIVIGGGFGETMPVWREVAVERAESLVVGLSHRRMPQLVPAQLGNQAGLIGVASLSRG